MALLRWQGLPVAERRLNMKDVNVTGSTQSLLDLPRVLDGGLILRQATRHDIERLAEFNVRIHADARLAGSVRDLMSGAHPVCRAGDFLLVEDPARDHALAASLCLIGQMWRYDDIPFAVGQPELVGTDPAYRQRGLMGILFEAVHALSAAHGDRAQAITGIPWIYRQVGYEYALDLGGHRQMDLGRIPALAEGAAESFRVRPAGEADLPILIALHETGSVHHPIRNALSLDDWRYDLAGRSPDAYFITRFSLIEAPDGRPAGYCRFLGQLEQGALMVEEVWTAPGVPLPAVLPALLRALKQHAEAAGAGTIRFFLGREHVLYRALDSQLSPLRLPYAFYLRVPDLAGFVREVAPALERRLARTPLAGTSGTLRLNFYTDGLALTLAGGRITAVEALDGCVAEGQHDAAFPPGVFLKLLFGYRPLAALREAYPDCWATDEAALLLEALFPAAPSYILPRM